MAAARYWRLSGIETYDYGADLSLALLALYASGVRVDTGASVTSSIAAISGTLPANVVFAGSDVRQPGFYIQWDFGTSTTVDEMRVTGVSASTFIYAGVLSSSADSVSWTQQTTLVGVVYSPSTPFSVAVPATFSGTSRTLALSTPPTDSVLGQASDYVGVLSVQPLDLPLDLEDGGFYRVVGTLKIKGPPNVAVSRRLRLIRDVDGRMVRETWSDAATGAYSFTYVRGDTTYTVLAYDYEHAYRAVVADNLVPEIMP